MFDKIGRFFLAYLIFSLALGLLVSSSIPLGLSAVLALAAGASVFYWKKLRSLLWQEELPRAKGEPALNRSILLDISNYEHSLEQQAAALAQHFTEDPLDNPSMVALSSLYLRESAEERNKLEQEYRALRSEFLVWQETFEKLRSERLSGITPTGAVILEYKKLADKLPRLQAYLTDLDARAREVPEAVGKALEVYAAASKVLEEARAAYGRVAASYAVPRLAKQIDETEAKLKEAQNAFRKEEERPLTAVRLSTDALEIAGEVKEASLKLVSLPTELDARLREFEEAAKKVGQEIAEAKEEFRVAAETYAPACWLEINGIGAAAERATQRARVLQQQAKEKKTSAGSDILSLESASRDIEKAFELLGRVSELCGRIKGHVDKVEAAVLTARGDVDSAEMEIDRVLALVYQEKSSQDTKKRQRGVLQRAGHLIDQAREELGKQQPDWLMIKTWAERAKELASQTKWRPHEEEDQLAGLGPILTTEKQRAKARLDSAQAVILSIDPHKLRDVSSVIMNLAQEAYQKALDLEASAMTNPDEEARAKTLQEAIEFFRRADEVAENAYKEAHQDFSNAEHEREEKVSVAASLVWGSLGLAASLLDDD